VRAVRLVAIIPARMAAQRLPGKMLADLGGRPVVVRVAEACAKARGVDRVVVATDDLRIAHAVEEAGFSAVQTSESCRNGTERVAEAARGLDADVILNIQGDEPLIDPAAVSSLAMLMREGVAYGTLARPLSPGDEDRPSVVKVVLDACGRALYFSRSMIPYLRNPRAGSDCAQPLAHLGLYGFSRSFLRTFAALPESPLEQAEGLEQLRALYHGHACHVRVGAWSSRAVDTPDDLEAVRALWAEREAAGRRPTSLTSPSQFAERREA
jgi:3-deoxy-manno-octulosonate cytidylyltransferase (CMP-KDO synthetase)